MLYFTVKTKNWLRWGIMFFNLGNNFNIIKGGDDEKVSF
jgi:hypothetical protein